MKLTCVTATYNVLAADNRDGLVRCVESVARIPVQHEHLVIDGASTDGTVELLRALSEKIPTLRIVSERDGGIYEALSKGAAAAKGEWFYVLGADDAIASPEALAACLAQAESEGDDLFVTPVCLGDGRCLPESVSAAAEMDVGMAYSHQGTFMRTALVRELGAFDRGYRLASDYKLHLLAHWRDARVGFAGNPFAEYGLDGVSSVASAQVLREECARVRCEVFGLSAAESERHIRTGALPLRVVVSFCRARESFNRRIGLSCLWHQVYRKHKDGRGSVRYLFGFPVWSHRRKDK